MIWSSATPAGTQAYVAFRRMFDLKHAPIAASLHLFADSRYLLWINGQHVLRGPSRFHPKRPEYDTLDIAPYLQTGPNVIVVLVHHYAGATNGRIIRHDPGLTALLIAEGKEILRSGDDWKCCAETEYQPSPGAWSSIPDIIDGRMHRGDWHLVDFDDSLWPKATLIDGFAWGRFHPRTTPLCHEEYLTDICLLPQGTPIAQTLPFELRAQVSRPWNYPGGFSGAWMWAPESAKILCFKSVWSNAGFGVGQGSMLMIQCDHRFVLFQNGREIARCDDSSSGWSGEIDMSDGDVLAIEVSHEDRKSIHTGLFVSMINHGNHILGTKDFRVASQLIPDDWKYSSDLTNFVALSAHHADADLDEGAPEIMMMDLGRMAMTYPTIELEAEQGSTLQIEYALRFIDGKPAESYGIGTTYTARDGRQTLLAADQWCARYVTVRCLSGRVKIISIQMTDRRYPYEKVGHLECSDRMLTTLWEMAVHTVQVTTDDAHGSDARERNEWVQDGSKASFQTMRVAAKHDIRTLRKLIIDAAVSQMPDGRIPGTFPTDRGSEDPHHFIDDYAMQWIESLRWHHEFTNDIHFTREMWPVLVRQMHWFLQRITSRGLLYAREYTSFDNPIAYLTCEGATINSFFYQSLRDAEWLAKQIGENAEIYQKTADDLAHAFHQLLWDDQAQAYSAGFLHGEKLPPSVHAQLMALYSGIVHESSITATRAWFHTNFRNPGAPLVVGVKSDFRDLLDKRAGLGMPIMFYWAFTEIYRIDTAEADLLAFCEMRARWGHMVHFLKDAGTLSESFVNAQGSGMNESCHNYGAIPSYFLSSFLLGVRVEHHPLSMHLVINPRPADIHSANGMVATPLGLVTMAWNIHHSEWTLNFQIPEGNHAELRLPDIEPSSLIVNGKLITHAQIIGRNTIMRIASGHHHVVATRNASVHAPNLQ